MGSCGIGGGKRWFHYEADTLNKILKLHNKNNFFCEDQNSVNHKEQYSGKLGADADGEACEEKYILKYKVINGSNVVLSGTNEKKESINIVLSKKQIKYPLLEGRYSAITLF